jgi:HEAT repeat protein
MAASAVGEIGPAARDAAPDLVECLEEAHDGPAGTRLRLQVARAVWRIQQEPGFLLSIGIEALGDAKWSLRRLAAQWLGELGPAAQPAVPHLERALKDEHPSVRRHAASALERIGRSPLPLGEG